MTKLCGARCLVTSLQAHSGAEPLRCGANRCAVHGGVARDAAPLSRADLVATQLTARVVRDERERTGRVANSGMLRFIGHNDWGE
eukprot:6730081-Prymnesium_polylepis.1